MRIRILDGVALAGALASAFLPADLSLHHEVVIGSIMLFWMRASSLATKLHLQQIHDAAHELNRTPWYAGKSSHRKHQFGPH